MDISNDKQKEIIILYYEKINEYEGDI